MAHRLQRLARLSARLGRSARTLAHTVGSLRAATSVAMLCSLLLMDFCIDGELDVLCMLAGG